MSESELTDLSTPRRAPRKLWPFALIAVVLTALASYMLFASNKTVPQREAVEASFTVDTRKLVRGSFVPEIPMIGITESTQQTQLRSRLNATVEALYVLEGMPVEAGEPLLKFNQVEAAAAFEQKQSEVAELEALIAEQRARASADRAALQTERNLLELSEKGLQRRQSLAKSGVTSQEQLEAAQTTLAQQKLALINRQFAVDNAKNQLSQLEARLDRAKTALQLAQLDFDQAELLAPFAARVESVSVAAGDRVNVSEPLLRLIGEDSLEVRAQIPNRWVPAVRSALSAQKTSGDEAVARPDARAQIFDQPVKLRLKRVAASANPGTGGVDAFFDFIGEAPFVLNKALAVTMRLPALDNVYSVPETAIYGDSTLYLVEELRMQPYGIIRLGRFADEKGTEQVIFRFAPDTDDRRAALASAGELAVVTTQLPKAAAGQLIVLREPAVDSQTKVPADSVSAKDGSGGSDDESSAAVN